jgi:hypothetical protein
MISSHACLLAWDEKVKLYLQSILKRKKERADLWCFSHAHLLHIYRIEVLYIRSVTANHRDGDRDDGDGLLEAE